MLTKICNACKLELTLDNFYKHETGKYGVTSHCKKCINKKVKIYKELHKEKRKQTERKYCIKNKERIKKVKRNYYINNKDKITKIRSLYLLSHKEEYRVYYNKYYKKRRAEDLVFRFTWNLRGSIYKSFNKLKKIKVNKTFNMLGYTPQDLHTHLSQYFNKPCEICNNEVIIENLRNYHMDHIIPVGSAITIEDVIRLNQFNNLRLLCKKCNIDKIKSDKEYIKNSKIIS